MNIKQTVIIILGIIGLVLIFIYSPRYKITQIDSENFIITEQSSSLYSRSGGTERLHWDKWLLYSGITIFAFGILVFAFKDKQIKTDGKDIF